MPEHNFLTKSQDYAKYYAGIIRQGLMAASGLVLGLDRAHGQNGQENVKIVNAFVWLLGGSHTVSLCQNFELFRRGKPVSEAQELLNHVQRASIVAGVCGENTVFPRKLVLPNDKYPL